MALVEMDGCLNFRDLGGYVGFGGKITKSDVLYRSDDLSKLSDDDIKIMKDKGIHLVIDLRSVSETKMGDYPLHEHSEFEYINIPLSDDMNADNAADVLPRTMTTLYICIVDEYSSSVSEILKLIAKNAGKGAVVFHCTAGKDRTGVISALILQLNGVSREDIVCDYSQSYTNMKPFFDMMVEPLRKRGISIPEYALRSDPDFLEKFLDYFEDKYQNAENYMRQIGLTEEEIKILANIL